MQDIPCIKDLNMIPEALKEDILKGKAIDVLLLLLSSKKTTKEISKILNLPPFSVQLYIKRLLDGELIRISDITVVEGRVEKSYELVSTDVDILNYIQRNASASRQESLDLSAQHFSTMTRNVILGIDQIAAKPHKIKAYFIKADDTTMRAFKAELDQLFERYQSLEDLACEDTYCFLSVLAPYKL